MSDIKEFNSSDVLEALTEKTVQTSEEVTVTTEDKSIEESVVVASVEPKVEQIEKKVETVVKKPTAVVRRVKDDVSIHLENLKLAANGAQRIAAWCKIIEVVVKYPKKSVFDEIHAFMKANKNEEFLSEAVALQNINTVEMTMHHRIRIFYTVMIGLARKTSTRRNTSIEVIRNIFSSDDFANWVAVQLDKHR